MSLNLLGKRKFSDINSDEYDTLSYSTLCCTLCRNSLIVRRYLNGTYAPICSLERHCKQCKHYVDCRDEQCPVCCLPESGEPVPSFSELVTAGVMCVKTHTLPVSLSAEPCTAVVVSGSSSADPVVSPGEPCTAMVVAGSASAEPKTTMLGVRTSSRRVHIKQCTISFNEQGFFHMVDIYNKFFTRVHDKLFSGDAAAMGGAAGGAAKFTVQELHELKIKYDKGAAWTADEVQELRALPLIMLKAHWKDEHQLNTFRDQLTNLMKHVSELQNASGKHDHEIAALQRAMAALDRVDAGSLLADADSVSAAGGAGSASFVANSSTVALLNKNFKQAWSERNELKTRIGTVDRTLKSHIADLYEQISELEQCVTSVADSFVATSSTVALINKNFKQDSSERNALKLRITNQQEQIHKLVQGIGAARLCSLDLDTRLKAVETAAGASATDFDARLKKLEAGPGYTREDFEKLKKEYDVSKPWTEEERAQWDQLPLILRKLQLKLNFNNNLFLRRITKLDQRTVALKQETTELKQALAKEQPAAAGSAVVAAGASVVDLDSRLKKLEAGTGHTREEIRKIKAGYDVTKNLTDEEFTQLASTPLILQTTHWRLERNIQTTYRQVCGVKQETAALKQALATEQQATAELKQALASQAQEIASLKQASASQAQEMAALKQAVQELLRCGARHAVKTEPV